MAWRESSVVLEGQFLSRAMRRLKEGAQLRKQKKRRGTATLNCGRSGQAADEPCSKLVHSPRDVFPEWILARRDFQNMDHLLRERRLTEALKSSPYLRRTDEAGTLATFITDAWPVARDLGHDRCLELGRCVSYESYANGESILKEGLASRSFYIIVKGAVSVLRAGEVVATLPTGTPSPLLSREFHLLHSSHAAVLAPHLALPGAARPGGCFGENAVEVRGHHRPLEKARAAFTSPFVALAPRRTAGSPTLRASLKARPSAS